MPFDFKAYSEKCDAMTAEELQREWEHYTRLISGASTSTAVSGIAVPFTLGVSLIGVGMAAPAIHNARKKREIIEAHLQKLGTTHNTRKRDVLGSMAVSGTIGVVTLGVGSAGADMITTAGAEHGISMLAENEMAVKVVTHVALEGAGVAAEHAHTKSKKERDAFKAFQLAGTLQAVQDAKAAEAGYGAVPPYNPQGYGDQVQPPPSYSSIPSNASFSDLKDPKLYVQDQNSIEFTGSLGSAQQYSPQQYGLSQVWHQQTRPSNSAPTSQSQHPSPAGEIHAPQPVYAQHDVKWAPPPTPALQQQQQQPQQLSFPQTQTPHPSQTPAPVYTPNPAYENFDMKSVMNSLPSPTPAPHYHDQHQQRPTLTPGSTYSSPPPQQLQHTQLPACFPPPSTSNNTPLAPSHKYTAQEPQYAAVPIPGTSNSSTYQTLCQPTHQSHERQQYQQAPQQQRQYHPAQQVHTHPQTPLSPPYSPPPILSQANRSSYFPAPPSFQGQCPPSHGQWNGQAQVQAPYTPAVTPGCQYPPPSQQLKQ